MEDKKIEGLKFQIRDGKTGQIVSDEPAQKVEEEGGKDAIKNTKSGSRSKG